ncbi:MULTISPECIES: hypothetical protein [unclassified Amycolatopsis]|uniref:hypothetical protein n=1 Tax=unclassified Amycolatopsis TaxID=2618356 RepID=UPI002E1C5A3E|nr:MULTISPECIES: hypothetical protein [unclassified Amycolatopsis]
MKKLLVLAVLFLVGACGVKPTPVVPAGPAPTLRNPATNGRGTDLVLYFVLDGRVRPVSRSTSETVDVTAALSTLLGGPSYAETSDGYATMLPAETGPIALSGGSPTTIRVAFPLKQLPQIAVDQLVCTAFAALAAGGGYVADGAITLAGSDIELPSQTCQAF